ncbi:MAG: hypothetical protein K9K88_17315 [Desulfobacterales bacterium]|nr:hypothetical protein [Desulfobacterales bacterium]
MPKITKVFRMLRPDFHNGGQLWQVLSGRYSGRTLPVILIVALLCVFSATGCGKKGPPVPPVDKREPVKEESLLRPPAMDVQDMMALVLKDCRDFRDDDFSDRILALKSIAASGKKTAFQYI